MKQVFTAFVLLSIVLGVGGCPPNNPEEAQLMSFIDTHVAQVRPLAKEAHLAYWQAAISGAEASYRRVGQLELQIRKIYSSPEDYARLKPGVCELWSGFEGRVSYLAGDYDDPLTYDRLR